MTIVPRGTIRHVAITLVLTAFIAFGGDSAPAAERPHFEGPIVISTNGDPTQTAGFKALAAAYKQYQPDVDVKVEITGGSVGGSDNYPTWQRVRDCPQFPSRR